MKNIVLTGFSATGKTAVAKEVARQLNWSFADTDEEVVKLAGKNIPEIFEQDGEIEFRRLECDVIKSLSEKENLVIATGGGAICNSGNQQLLRKLGTVVCLEATPTTIYRRLIQDAAYSVNPVVRPLLAGDNPLEQITQLKSSRQLHYANADWTVHTDNLTVEEASREVIRGWQYAVCQAGETLLLEQGIACLVFAASGSYPVFVGWGLIEELGDKMKSAGLSGMAVVISDESVFALHGSRVIRTLENAGFTVTYLAMPPGEATKNIDCAAKIYDFLVTHRVERNDVIVALGGGVVGDLSGFVAATYLRGIPWVHVPTTLVGMADASIGGKVAIDHAKGKNLIGAFYHPRLVMADVQTLTTLPRRELTSGWAEVIKYGLILDCAFFEFLETSAASLVNLDPESTTRTIAHSAKIKAAVVSEDEREKGSRMILNYGHTIAHGIEAATRYQRFLHGEAVAVGMMGAAILSHRLGLLCSEAVRRQRSLLQKFSLPVDCSGVNLADVLAAMQLDKKTRNKTIQWVLLRDIGETVIRSDVPDEDVIAVLHEVVKT